MRAGDKVRVLNAAPDNDTVHDGVISRLHGSTIPVGVVPAEINVDVVVGADTIRLTRVHLYATRRAAEHYVEARRLAFERSGLSHDHKAVVAYLR